MVDADRAIVRRRTFALPTLSTDEAVDEMVRRGWAFHLFICRETGNACVVSRRPGGAVKVESTGRRPPPRPWLVTELTPAPTLTEQGAVRQLEETGAPFVLYVDAVDGVPSVLYRLPDGGLGLLTADRRDVSAAL